MSRELTPATREVIRVAADAAVMFSPSQWHDLPTGERIRVTITHDPDLNPFTDYDIYGQVARTNAQRHRPPGFTGAARKIWVTRDGPVWWQPPADVVSDPAMLKTAYDRARGWFDDSWTYVCLNVAVEGVPCATCGARKVAEASVGGIESDSGTDYFAEVVGDLYAEATV